MRASTGACSAGSGTHGAKSTSSGASAATRRRTPAFASLVSAQLAGLVMLRYVIAVEPPASLDFEELMEWLVPAIEVHFDRLPQE